MKEFLDFTTAEDARRLVDSALLCKANPLADQGLGRNKTMVLLFLNPSLRTRLSTQKAAQNLGMHCLVLNASQDGWQLEFEDGAVMDGGKAEHVREAAAVISQYADVIGVRTFAGLSDRNYDYAETVLRAIARYATVPVVNLESATVHPLQSLADLMTIREHTPAGKRPKVVLTWAPHPRALPQAVANSFARWATGTGLDLTITHPQGYELDPEFTAGAEICYDQREAFRDADFIYAKNWSAWSDYGRVLSTDDSWMVTAEKMELTSAGRFMHCLPVRRNVIVEDAVLDGPASVVIPQAGNREWAAQAVLREILLGL